MCPAGPASAEFRVETRLCAQVPTGRRRGMELQSPGDGVWGIHTLLGVSQAGLW